MTSGSLPARLAWGLFALSLVAVAAELVLLGGNAGTPPPEDFGSRGVEVVDTLVFLLFPATGALIAARRPRNSVGWLIAGVSLIVATEELAREYAFYGLVTSPGALPGAGFASWYFEISWIFGLAGMPLLFLVFPDGRLLSRRWLPVVVAAAVPAMIVAGPIAAQVWPHRGQTLLLEPQSIPAVSEAEAVIGPALLLLLAAFVVSLASLVVRYRRAGSTQRQQLKWLLAAGIVLVAEAVVSDIAFPGPASAAEELAGTVAICLVPIAIGIAILRHRLYDIDRIINRAIVYALVTGSLVAIYAGIVFVSGTVVVDPGDNFTVAVATLAAAALFRPLLQRVQAFVDRRFYRHKYDAQQTVDDFGVRLRAQTDLEYLTHDLVGVVRTTMQPAHVSLWLREPEGAR